MFRHKRLYRFFRVFFFSIGLTIVSTSVPAFLGEEHSQISDLAFNIAVEYNCSEKADITKKCKQLREVSESLGFQGREENKESKSPMDSGDPENKKKFTYGMINELVDYMHYPEQIFEHFNFKDPIPFPPRKVAERPERPEHLNQHVLSLRENQLSRLALFDYLSASSHNERHFQDALMESMHYLHKSAVLDAQQGEGYLYSALVKNALSDHYLNDYFAPGHITTARENSHDTVALAMHDRANKAGTCFSIKPEYWGKLEPILSFIKDGSYESYITGELEDAKEIDTIVANINECDQIADDGGKFKEISSATNIDEGKIQRLAIDVLSEHHETLFLQGDGYLRHNPVQQLFMILVQVKSISEVMDAYINCNNDLRTECRTNYITQYFWEGSYDYEKYEIKAPEARTEFGAYNISYKPGEEVANESVLFFLDRPKYAYPAVADNAFLFSIGGQTPVSQESSRFELQLEIFPLRIGTANQFESLRNMTVHRPSTGCIFWCNLGFAYGLTYVDDDFFEASSIQLRAIKAYPKISALLSASVRRGKYQGENESQTRTSYGIRYDHGFSLHTFYVGYQWDYGYDATNTFHDENVITFGWSLSFPSSRFLGYFGG